MSYDGYGFSGDGLELHLNNGTALHCNDDDFGPRYVQTSEDPLASGFSNSHDAFTKFQETSNYALFANAAYDHYVGVSGPAIFNPVQAAAPLTNEWLAGIMQQDMNIGGDMGGTFGLNNFNLQGPLDQSTHPHANPYLAFGSPVSGFSSSTFSSRGNTPPGVCPVEEYFPNVQYQIPQVPHAVQAYPMPSVFAGLDPSVGRQNFCAAAPADAQNVPQVPYPIHLFGVDSSGVMEPTALDNATVNATVANAQSPRPPSATAATGNAKTKANVGPKPRSSISVSVLGRKKGKQCSPNSTIPCTVPGCPLLFHCKKTRDRHVLTHGIEPPTFYPCPGMYIREEHFKKCTCKGEGYAREDVLTRHLKQLHSRDPNSPCVIEAMKLGWDIDVVASVKNLRGYKPTPPESVNYM